jgi:hypothetical protein
MWLRGSVVNFPECKVFLLVLENEKQSKTCTGLVEGFEENMPTMRPM